MSDALSTDLVSRLRAEVVVPYKDGYEPFRAPPSKLMIEAADEIERLRGEMKRINDLAIHLSSGGRDPDEKCYTKRDVEALVAISLAVKTKHSTRSE